MYAYDVILFSESDEGLKSLLGELAIDCKEWKLCVNIDKYKIIVFRNNGKNRSNEEWYVGEAVL